MDTVVFFDEANTTDAIGLIKEIMCDRRLHGRPVSTDLKFIAACNPYRRYTYMPVLSLVLYSIPLILGFVPRSYS